MEEYFICRWQKTLLNGGSSIPVGVLVRDKGNRKKYALRSIRSHRDLPEEFRPDDRTRGTETLDNLEQVFARKPDPFDYRYGYNLFFEATEVTTEGTLSEQADILFAQLVKPYYNNL